MENNTIKIFDDRKVRTIWDADMEKWYLSIVDTIAVLTDQPESKKILECIKNKVKSRGKSVSYKL
jgi:hypothetical protein